LTSSAGNLKIRNKMENVELKKFALQIALSVNSKQSVNTLGLQEEVTMDKVIGDADKIVNWLNSQPSNSK